MTIEAEGLHKAYDDGTVALDRVDFSVRAGEVFGYLGRNGAGKTTTVRILSTLVRPTSGTVRVLGLDVVQRRQEVRDRIGLSLQQAALDPLMTGREHLALIASLRAGGRRGTRGPGRRERAARVEELLASFGLTEVADRLVATYTVGMRRRLDATLALVHRPSLLFLDEPTTGLDPQSRRALWSFVRRFREDGGTVFLTTQYLDEADALCDRIAILKDGRVAVVDTPQGLKRGLGGKVLKLPADEPGVRDTAVALVGEPACRVDGTVLTVDLSAREELLPELLGRLRDAGLPLNRMTVADPTVEDVFVRLTGDTLESGGGSGAAAVGAVALSRTLGSGNTASTGQGGF
ncbi:ATP-binding cassette domain-containing protein [Streptomyces sp.]|uniref:ATP-binding cassette domain-containing protein n=2 Tax=Streptomyces sp. TaxID=1931 RepID=UPI0028111E9A|nr:ATP-binding cassette domain-containing protein [Streptomyces sp.]